MFDSQEHEALLAAVRARHDDDEPRLEYARWLEESRRAEARDRAELIRVQLALASDHHPDAAALEARELELLGAHAARWLPEHPALRRVRFRRGFIEYAHLHLRHYLHHRRQLRRLGPVRALSLTGWNRCDASLVERVAACEELADIESLAIHHQGPHKSPRDEVAILLDSPHLSAVVELALPLMEIERETRLRIERCALLRRVRRLHLTGLDTLMRDTGEWLEGGAEPLLEWNELRGLDLTGGFGTRPELLRKMMRAPFWDHLRDLAVDLPLFEPVGITRELAEGLPAGLRALTLNGSAGAVSGRRYEIARELPAAAGARPLESLTLRRIPLDRQELEACLRSTTLAHLTLESCEVNAQAASALARAPLALRTLDVRRDARFDDRAATVLFASDVVRSLTSLRVDNTKLGAAGFDAIAASAMTTLRFIDATVDGASADAFARFLGSPAAAALVWIELEDSGDARTLSRTLVSRLAALPFLRGFTMRRSELAPEELARRLPAVAWPIVLVTDWNTVFDDYGDYRPSRWPPTDRGMALADRWA